MLYKNVFRLCLLVLSELLSSRAVQPQNSARDPCHWQWPSEPRDSGETRETATGQWLMNDRLAKGTRVSPIIIMMMISKFFAKSEPPRHGAPVTTGSTI
jgi:hypothetical protein